MGFLNPALLLATLAVAIPLFLHLFQRSDSRRLAFPALRYLQRTEKEHARRIRLRQLLLLVLRVLAVLLLALAAARPFLTGPGSAHPPTALAIVLDNSLSSGLVEDDLRALDRMKEIALESVRRSSDRDRIWVLRAGEPWDVAVPGSSEDARARVQQTEVSDAAGDLDEALRRAVALVASSDLGAREVHLISDLQASGFPDENPPVLPVDVDVVVFSPDGEPPSNHAVAGVLVGGGLVPVEGQRGQVAADILGEPASDSVPVRLIVDGRVRAATIAPVGSTVLLALGVLPPGRITGFVETDPDGLRADDRRYFSFRVRPPPRVAVAGGPAPFLNEALSVLADDGRVTLGTVPGDVLVSVGGVGLDTRGTTTPAVLVIPAPDPALLPALNRRLAAGGIPWEYHSIPETGEESVTVGRVPHDFSEVRVYERFGLQRVDGAPQGGSGLIEVGASEAWLVGGSAESGRYLLLGSPLDLTSSTLPVSAVLVPFLEWAVSGWAEADGDGRGALAGTTFAVPVGASAVADPEGRLVPIGEGSLARTRTAGIYSVLAGDSVLQEVPVNSDPSESELARIPGATLMARLGRDLRLADEAAWPRAIFTRRQGPELWRPLLLVALLVLLLESVVAATGRAESAPSGTGSTRPQGAN